MKLKEVRKNSRKKIIYFSIVLIVLFSVWMFVSEGKKINALDTQVEIFKEANLNPGEPIVVLFSSEFLEKSYRGKIKIEPEVEFDETYEKNKIILTPEKHWPVGKKINIFLPKGRNFIFLPIKSKEFSVSISDYPKISYVYPYHNSKDVLVGIEDPIKISFLSSTVGFKINFETNPKRELFVSSDVSRKEFKILPKKPFSPGTNVELKIFATYSGSFSQESKKIFENNFTILPLAPSKWSKDLGERLLEVRKFTKPKLSNGKYIDVNLDAQVLSIFENGEIIESFLVSSGKRGMETPKGEFQIYNKFPKPWSKAYSLFMPFWMAITSSGKYGIHELPEWSGGYKEGAGHLGIPVSHGCVRLGVGAAEKVYNFAEIGIKVIIY